MPEGIGVVNNGGKPGLRKSLGQLHETSNVRTDRLIGQQHIRRAALGGHFRFSDSGAFEFSDAAGHLHPNQFGQFVGFDVRAKTLRAAGNPEHARDVFLDALRIQEQRRRRDLANVGDLVPGNAVVLHLKLEARPIGNRRHSRLETCAPPACGCWTHTA